MLLLFGVGFKLVNDVHQICDRVKLLVLFLLFKDKFCPEIKVLFDQDSCLIFILWDFSFGLRGFSVCFELCGFGLRGRSRYFEF